MNPLRLAKRNWKTTLGGVAALAGATVTVIHDPSRLTDPTVIGLFGAGIAGVMGKDADVTGGTKPNVEPDDE